MPRLMPSCIMCKKSMMMEFDIEISEILKHCKYIETQRIRKPKAKPKNSLHIIPDGVWRQRSKFYPQGAGVAASFHSNQTGAMPDSTCLISRSSLFVWLVLGWNENQPHLSNPRCRTFSAAGHSNKPDVTRLKTRDLCK